MDLSNYLNNQQLLEKKDQIKKIFFYRICGTGMGACACLLKEAGFEISGADLSYSPPMSTYLETTGIDLFDLKEVDEEFLKQFDLIVVGNSVPKNSDYARQIEQCGTAFTSFPTVLGTLVLKDKEVIGIAGTHGKTTTTYFMVQMFEKLGIDVGYLIGGIIDGRPPSRIGESKYFIIESDEYDCAYFQKFSKFRQYEIDHLILTSLEFDHADIFETIEDIEDEFKALLENRDLKSLIFDHSYPSAKKIANLSKQFSGPQLSEYSLDELNILIENSQGSKFKLKDNEYESAVIGKQNLLNLSSCILFFNQVGLSTEGIKEVGMVKRRQELRGKYHNALVVDDFAHHPRSVELTIDAVKTKFDNENIVVVFEPVSATARSNIFQKQFTDSLKIAKKVILANPMMKTSAKNGDDLNFDLMKADLISAGIESEHCQDLGSLRASIDTYIKDFSQDCVLLVLSNRTCLGLWESDFVNQLD